MSRNDSNQNSGPAKAWQASEFKNLIQNQGKAKIAGQEWELNNPSYNDANLQTIIKDPRFTVKPIGTQNPNGQWTYELLGNGKSTKVTISQSTR
jgi:hypothetical protein